MNLTNAAARWTAFASYAQCYADHSAARGHRVTEVAPEISAPDSKHRLASGLTAARLTLLGFFLVTAAAILWRIFQLTPRVGAGRALAFLWTVGAFSTALAAFDGLALFWAERRRPVGYYMAAVAVLTPAIRIHVLAMYSNVQPETRIESVTAGIVRWALTAALLWLVAVFYRTARLAEGSSVGVSGRAA